jgi:hypothetical protein
MGRKRKDKQRPQLPNIDSVKKTVAENGDATCACNWEMAVTCVDDLMEWVQVLLKENQDLKGTLQKTIEDIDKGNKSMRKQLKSMMLKPSE